jgi:molybdenum cofactor cytidylyltransferase
MQKTAILILAAGSSSRLGQPKQLLSYQHKTLLQNTIEAAQKVPAEKVLVILGDNHELISAGIGSTGVQSVYNEDWEIGMSSSIRLGLARLLVEDTTLDAVILTVCDQPFITDKVFRALLAEARTSVRSIIASSYSGTLGTPVLFGRRYFEELALLEGTEGAKTLLIKYQDQVASVPFDKGEIDIDTPEDYNKLISSI